MENKYGEFQDFVDTCRKYLEPAPQPVRKKLFVPADDTIERVVQFYIDQKYIAEMFANRARRK